VQGVAKVNDWLAEILVEKRVLLLILVLIATAISAYFLKNLGIENSLEVWFLKNDRVLIDYNEFKRVYGNDEVILVWVKPEKGIYDKTFAGRMYDVSNQLGKHKLVKRILSITKAPYLDSKGEMLIVEDILKSKPDASYDPENFKKRLNSNPMMRKLLLNKDSSATVIVIEPVVTDEMDAKRPELIGYVKDNLKGMDFKLMGTGVIYDELNRLTLNDASLFTGLTYIILLVSILIFYRKKSIMIATTATIVLISVLILGVLGLFKQKLNTVSAILPSLVLIMCLEDIIFIYSHYYDTPPSERDIKKTVSHVLVPCFFTSFTTAVGFFSFCTSPMKILKYFGIFAAVAVILEYVVSIIIGTFVLEFIEKRSKRQGTPVESEKEFYETFFRPRLIKVNTFVQKHNKALAAFFFLILVACLFGITKIKVDTYTIGMLKESNGIRRDSVFFEKDYGFYVPLEVRLIPKSGTIKDPEFLKGLSLLQDEIEKDPSYNKSTSIADVVKQLNRVLTDNKESSYKIPDTGNAIAQELLLYEMDGGNDLWYFVDSSYTEARLTIHVPMASSRSLRAVIDKTEKMINETFRGHVSVAFGGYIPLYIKLIEYIARTQVESFILAFILIFASTTILLRSWYYLFIIIIPNIIPIIFTLGFMGFTGINLDVATVTVAAITIGLSVDNTIHYLYYFKLLRKAGMGVRDAVRETLLFKGAPMFISNIILVFGYLIMIFGHVTSVVYFGILTSLTLSVALLCDILLLPSLLILFSGERAACENSMETAADS
jgi:uncharacterized protein